MIAGAEGLIGLVNIIVLLGVIALIILIIHAVRFKRNAIFKQNVQKNLKKYTAAGLLLALIALPAVSIGVYSAYDYFKYKSYNDEFEANNTNFSALYSTILKDDLGAFKQALTTCGSYCIKVNPGAKKYDNLLVTTVDLKANKITAYLVALNQAEVTTPQ